MRPTSDAAHRSPRAPDAARAPAVPPDRAVPQPLPAATPAEPVVSRRVVFRVGVTAALFVWLFAVVGGTEMAPPHALVLDDATTRTYTTPACASSRPATAPPLVRMTKAEAEDRGHTPDPACMNAGGFFGRSRSRLKEVLIALHLDRGSEESRWRPDGTWRW